MNAGKITKTKLTYNTRIKVWGIIFILPAVSILICFNIYPMIRAFILSLTSYEMGLKSYHFVGFANYIKILTSKVFLNSLQVSFIYVFGTVVVVWLISFGLAFLLKKVRIFVNGWRILLFLPSIMPIVSIVLVWKLLFHYNGFINSMLRYLNISPIGWLNDSSFAPLGLIIVSWWHAVSYYMIFFLAGLQGVPSEYNEAAQLDGANAWQRMIHVTLPIMRPTIVLVMVLSIINGFRTFALQKIMTGGGPGRATEITTLLIYKTAFTFGMVNEAAAMSIIYFLIILVFSLIQLKILRGGTSVI